MRKVGDYSWAQLSMWDFSPENCVEKHVKSDCGKHIFHFYLKKIVEVFSESHWKVETVTSLEDVPEEVLNWRSNDYALKIDGKRQTIFRDGKETK
jgi:hypothetical protein